MTTEPVEAMDGVGTAHSLQLCRLSEGMDPGFLKIMPPPVPAARDMFSVL